LHCHQPDGIFAGVLKYMGWEATTVDTDTGAFAHWNVTLPEQSLGELMEHIKSTLNLNGLRYVGDADMRIKNMTLVGHLYPMPTGRKRSDGKPFEYSVGIIDKMEKWADVILPGEIIEWTVLSYVRDAIQLGKTKAVVNIGHYNWEELGMRYAKDWLTELLGDAVPVSYVPSGDMYRFI
jgi:putative NIF3 family GTP cyclohydrolase 1 type 2